MALLKEEHLIVNYIFTLAVYRLAPTLLLYMHVSSRQHTASNYTLIDFKMTVMKRNTNKQCWPIHAFNVNATERCSRNKEHSKYSNLQ